MTKDIPLLISDVFQSEAFINDVRAAVAAPVTGMFGVAVESTFTSGVGGKPFYQEALYGSVGLIQKDVIGQLVICFPDPTIVGILKGLYARELDPREPACIHGVGEITNMIFGVLKQRLNRQELFFQFAIPQVTNASSFTVPDAAWTLIGKFQSAPGPFELHLALREVG